MSNSITATYNSTNTSIESSSKTVTKRDLIMNSSSEVRTAEPINIYGPGGRPSVSSEIQELDLSAETEEKKAMIRPNQYGPGGKPPVNIQPNPLNNTPTETLNPVEQVLQDLETKAVVSSVPDTQGLCDTIITYEDGTTRMVGLNQNFWPNGKEQIIIPITPDGSQSKSIVIFEGRDDGLTAQEFQNDLIIEEDPIMGKVTSSQTHDYVSYYEGREDKLVKETVYPINVDYTRKQEFEGREDGVKAIEEYPNKIITYYIDGRAIERSI
jgi:hypothetical protein